MSIDLNQTPYFDDYNEDKKFLRVLFKPSVAVQARELTQLQTILQKQIENFGRHIFVDGTIVLGGSFDVQTSIAVVRVNVSGQTQLDNLIKTTLIGNVTGLTAYVVHAELDEDEVNVGNLFVRYQNNTPSASVFTGNESLTNGVETINTTVSNATGTGAIFSISEGVAFVQGYFVKFDKQTVALSTTTSTPSKKVYFNHKFTVVDSNEDTSLLDNAQGFNNVNAPGADRLAAELTLVTTEPTVNLTDDDHSLLFEIEDGIVKQRNDRTQYSRIYDEIAKRTYDESGDYVVRGMDVFTREHLDTGDNGGRLTANNGGDNSLISVGIESGLAYVKGYEINTLTTRYIDIPKASEYENVDNQVAYVRSGNYIYVNEVMGLPEPDKAITVNLYDTAEQRSTNSTNYQAAPGGTIIGTARINTYQEQSGTLGNANAELRIYINDIKMNNGQTFSDVRAVGNTSHFFADVSLDSSNNVILYDAGQVSRLYSTGSGATRSVKDSTDTSDFSYFFARQVTGNNFDGTGSVTISISTTDESLPYSSGNLSDLSKDTILVSIDDDAEATMSGTVTFTSGNSVVTGSGTSFTNLNVGDRLTLDGNYYIVDSITNNTEVVLTENVTTSNTGASFTKHFSKGDLIDLNAKGSADGNIRTASVSGSSIVINVKENFTTTPSVKITHQAVRNAKEIQKTLKPNRIVLVDGSSAANLNVIPLGFSDVYQIKEIRKHTSPFVSDTDGVDVTSDYVLNNGQTPYSYETATILTNNPIANTEYLMIKLDYFDSQIPSDVGYFTVDSYPIDDTVEADDKIKTINMPRFQGNNLRNVIDFRPVKQNLASDSTTIAGASTNPAKSSTYKIATNGLRLPLPGTTMTFDYSYYLPRYDVAVVDKEGNFKVVKGKSNRNATLPVVSDTFMKLANLYIPPYPSVAQTYARKLDRIDEGVQSEKITFARYTMRDIGNIKKRVKNLEYYNALNLIEKSTIDLTLPDQNGLDRFKNGVFVDAFADKSLSDAGHPDFNVAVDKKEKVIRPAFDLDGYEIRLDLNNSPDITQSGDLITADYTESVLIDQPNITTFRNIEQSVFRYIGDLELYPRINNWVDTNTVDQIISDNSALPSGKTVTTDWESWESSKSGSVSGTQSYKVYFRQRGEMEEDFLAGNLDTIIIDDDDWDEYVAQLGYVPQYTRSRGDYVVKSTKESRFLGEFSTQQEAKQYLEQNNIKRAFIVQGGTSTEIETLSRTGIETTINVTDEYTDLGSFVTDVKFIPYIKSQTIRLYAQGLKANTRFFVFFDGEDMSDYVTPVAIANNDLNDLSGIGSEGAELKSDEFGDFLGFLRLPESGKRFRSGVKVVRITDSPTDAEDATSFAEEKFVSAGLLLQKQNTILSTQNVSEERRAVTETETKTRTVSTPQKVERYGPSCMAYSFYVDEPETTEGIFLTSVDVYIAQMSEDLGVWFEIREMNNSGGITRNMVPFSKVWMKRNDPRINVSPDGSTPTNVNFSSPVFLYNKTQYAFVIHTEGLNPDTYFWVSRLGETDINTGNQITGRQLTGTTYTTNNNLNWDIVPDVDLTCTFYRANFDVEAGKTVTATFNNEDLEFISGTLPSTFFNVGEPVKGTEIVELGNLGVHTMAVGDIIRDQVTGLEAEVLSVDGTEIYTDAHDFIVGANVEVYDSSNTLQVSDATVSTVDFGLGVIRSVDTGNNSFIIDHSNGRFFVGSQLRSVLPNRHTSILNGTYTSVSYSNISTSTIPNPYFAETGDITLKVGQAAGSGYPTYTIDGFDRFNYTAVTFRPGFLNFDANTDISFTYRSVTNNSLDTAKVALPFDTIEMNNTKNILSRSEEISLLGGSKSFQIVSTLESSNPYLSPVIDNTTLNCVFVNNILTDVSNTETLPFSSSDNSAYISKVVTLNDQNDAEDLIAFLEEYRPLNTEIKVYARLANKYDTETIAVKDWFELETTKNITSSTTNKYNFIDTQYSIPDAMKTGSFGEVQYTSGNGNVYTGYKEFQIKIVLLGGDPAVYPKGAKLRAIALQV